MGSRGPVSGTGASSAKAVAPKMPRALTEDERRAWRVLVPRLMKCGVKLSPIDEGALARLCQIRVLLPKIEAEITRGGYTVNSYRGDKTRNPLWMVRSQLVTELAALEAKFGMTPADRARLDTEQADESRVSLADALFAKVGQGGK